MTTSEKIAYLKGLAEGLGLGKETKEDKLLTAIIDTLECIARDIEDLEETAFDLGEELDAVSDDLASLETAVYEECDCCHGHDDNEGCCHGHDDDCCHDHGGHGHEGDCCHGHGGGHGHIHGGERGHGCCHARHGATMYEVTCPACDAGITIDEDVLKLGTIECPSCGGLLEFDLVDEEEVGVAKETQSAEEAESAEEVENENEAE